MSKIFRSKYFPFSKLTFFLGLFIIISASFMRQLMNFAKANIGDSGFAVLISSILIMSALAFLVFIMKNAFYRERSRPFPILIIIAIGVIGLFLTWQIEIAEEKIHLLEFAVLGWLALSDTIRVHKTAKAITIALTFALAIGVLDEGFQAILPYRYFQSWDILLNSLGGVWGIVLFLVFRGKR